MENSTNIYEDITEEIARIKLSLKNIADKFKIEEDTDMLEIELTSKNYKKRNISGYNLFQKDFFTSPTLNNNDIDDFDDNQGKKIKITDEKIQFKCGESWKNLSQEERDKYNDDAKNSEIKASEMTYITSNKFKIEEDTVLDMLEIELTSKNYKKRNISGYNLFQKDFFTSPTLNNNDIDDFDDNQGKKIKITDEKIQFKCGESWKNLSQEERDKYNDDAKNSEIKASEMTYITSSSLRKKSIKKIFDKWKNEAKILYKQCGIDILVLHCSHRDALLSSIFGTPAADDFAKNYKSTTSYLQSFSSWAKIHYDRKNGEINAMPYHMNNENSTSNFEDIDDDDIVNEQSIIQLKRAPSSNDSTKI
ncbi:hypothetical protein Glove_24g31 [Diversispora epigaea]|uniref:HMG box domain-containing protein n=1 Tax=Diversispora epigaea TaxID=1348612 RepID=A0A397JQG6_9GLOM|nr:hypothetical protein Glove_24g31 [Diversispora epigaea]